MALLWWWKGEFINNYAGTAGTNQAYPRPNEIYVP